MVSALTGKPVRKNVAMTGDNLKRQGSSDRRSQGKVLAAHRAGIDTIIIPVENKKTLRDT